MTQEQKINYLFNMLIDVCKFHDKTKADVLLRIEKKSQSVLADYHNAINTMVTRAKDDVKEPLALDMIEKLTVDVQESTEFYKDLLKNIRGY